MIADKDYYKLLCKSTPDQDMILLLIIFYYKQKISGFMFILQY